MRLLRRSGLLAVLTCASLAADPRGDNPDAPPSTAQEQLAQFHVPPGFEVQLVADETQIQKPMNFAFDAAGRLWVTGSELYPGPAKVDALGQPIPGFDQVWAATAGSFDTAKAPAPPERGTDSVRILSDFAPDGRARRMDVFADGLNIPIGLTPLPRGTPVHAAIYATRPAFDPNPDMQKTTPRIGRHFAKTPKGDSAIVFSIPHIWLLTDWNGDGRADTREPLYTGFDFKDTHGMASNFLHWLDGWIYGCHGFRNRSEVRDRAGNVTVFDSGNTFRFKPDGSKIEHYTHGQTNPFGLTVDPLGNFYSADSHSKPVMLLQPGGFYEGIGKQHDGLGFAPRITDDDHGSSAIAGVAYYADEKFPAEFRGNLFNGNPVTRSINRARLEWHGSTPRAIRLPDFLTCDDPWFRPIQVKLGPDGALWIADFYNPIIGHYEFSLADPRRDHQRGRIWRVVWKGKGAEPPGHAPVPGALPDLTKLAAPALVETLADPNLVVRTLATHELAERIGREAAPLLRSIFASGHPWLWQGHGGRPLPEAPATQRLHALWVLERIREMNDVAAAYFSSEDRARAPMLLRLHLARVFADREDRSDWEMLQDSDAFVLRSAVAAARLPNVRTVGKLLDLLAHTPADDAALVHALRMSLRDQLAKPRILAGFLAAGLPDDAAREHLAEVALAIPTAESADFLLQHLERTNFAAPRAGEFLRHAALHLPAERMSEIAALAEEMKAAPLSQRLGLAGALGEASRRRPLKLPETLVAWSQRTMLEALAGGDEPLLKRAIEAVREQQFDAKLDPLSAIVRAPQRPGALRLAALEAAANLPASGALLEATLADPAHLILRKRAAELLVQKGRLEAALVALPGAPQELALSIAGALGKSDAGAGALLDFMATGRASPRLLLHKSVAGSFAARSPSLRDRASAATRDLPPEDARLNGVIAERAAAFAKAKPDATRGAQLFQQHCSACHRFREVGGTIAPNLDGVAARGIERLLEDILDPHRNVDPLFRQTTIETTTGELVIGANLREQPEAILLADPTGREVTVPKARIKTRTASALSLMPAVFESALPPDDLRDLIAHLLTPPAAR